MVRYFNLENEMESGLELQFCDLSNRIGIPSPKTKSQNSVYPWTEDFWTWNSTAALSFHFVSDRIQLRDSEVLVSKVIFIIAFLFSARIMLVRLWSIISPYVRECFVGNIQSLCRSIFTPMVNGWSTVTDYCPSSFIFKFLSSIRMSRS